MNMEKVKGSITNIFAGLKKLTADKILTGKFLKKNRKFLKKKYN